MDLAEPDKEQARRRFNFLTETFGESVHTFDFDEAWSYAMHKRTEKAYPQELAPAETVSEQRLTKKEFQEYIMDFQGQLSGIEGAMIGAEHEETNPLKHYFTEGQYIRQIFNPKGEVIVTKIHKQRHPFFLMRGDMSILSEEGIKRIRAPYFGITDPGTKRIIVTHADCIFITVHRTDKTDLAEIEAEIVSPEFEEIEVPI